MIPRKPLQNTFPYSQLTTRKEKSCQEASLMSRTCSAIASTSACGRETSLEMEGGGGWRRLLTLLHPNTISHFVLILGFKHLLNTQSFAALHVGNPQKTSQKSKARSSTALPERCTWSTFKLVKVWGTPIYNNTTYNWATTAASSGLT